MDEDSLTFKFTKGVIVTIVFVPIAFLVGLAFAWVPMLGWNWGISEIFPNLPKVTYWQTFWSVQVLMYLVHRPSS